MSAEYQTLTQPLIADSRRQRQSFLTEPWRIVYHFHFKRIKNKSKNGKNDRKKETNLSGNAKVKHIDIVIKVSKARAVAAKNSLLIIIQGIVKNCDIQTN